jgi:transcriptional regulator with XRE-family HTH domain
MTNDEKRKEDEDREPFWWDLDGRETTFVENMTALREQRGMSQTEFAKRARERHGLPFHQPTVARIEAGQRPVKLHEAFTIAKILGTDYQAMMDELSLPFAYDTVRDYIQRIQAMGDAGSLTDTARSPKWSANELRESIVDYRSAAQRFNDEPNTELVDHAERVLRLTEELIALAEARDAELSAKIGEIKALKADLPAEPHGPRPYLRRLDDDTEVK